MRDDELRAALKEAPLPDPDAAEERAWQVVHAAFVSELEEMAEEGRTERQGVAGRWDDLKKAPFGLRLGGFLIALVVGVSVITPARALVAGWVEDAIRGPKVESTTISVSPPGGGRLLVQGSGGTWVTDDDGSRRHVGSFEDSVWSPRGRFVAAVDDRQLVALEPDGDVRWALTRPTRVSLPSWNSPDGFRIAYVEGRQLRIIAGDGTGDSPLAGGVDAVRPAWRPGPAYDLAFARPGGRVEVIDTRSGERLFSHKEGGRIGGLEWSHNGSRLMVWTKGSVSILDSAGREVWTYSPRPGRSIGAATIRPGSSQLVLIEAGQQSRVLLTGPGRRQTTLLAAGRLVDPLWSAGGKQLMIAWPETDQWLFLRGADLDRVDALGEIAGQFSPGAGERASFPRATGWCCSR